MASSKAYYQWLRKKIDEGKCELETLSPFVLGVVGNIAKKQDNQEIIHLLKAYRVLLKKELKKEQAKTASSN